MGGTGFFGKAFIKAFLSGRLSSWNVEELMIASRNATAFGEASKFNTVKKISFFDIDLLQAQNMPHSDYLLHFATKSDSRIYQEDPSCQKALIEQNMESFKNLVFRMKRPPKAILFASSGAVYGRQGIAGFNEDSELQSLDGLPLEKKAYGTGKRRAERTFTELSNHVRKISIARCFAFCGPEIPLDQHFVAGNLIKNVLLQQRLLLHAKHEVIRSYLHSEDLVTWLMTVLESGDQKCPIFNVGSDDSISIFELANFLSKYYGLPLDTNEHHSTEVDRYVPNIQKARLMGLTPSRTSLRTIIDTIEGLKNSGQICV